MRIPIKESNEEYTNFINDIIFPLLGVIITFFILLSYPRILNKSFYLINSNKVILYSTTEYYIIADCKIDEENDKLIVYTSTQEKISTDNIKTQYKTFKSISKK